jgi:hypothetical protein
MNKIVALGFAAALTALGTAPASANANETLGASSSTVRLDAAEPISARCGCGRYYVRYYVPRRYVYTYRVRYVRYYYY